MIISSHDLPLMNGVQFIKSILRGDKRFYVPIIALIDSPNDALLKTYFEIGIRAIISKPIDFKLFQKEINMALN